MKQASQRTIREAYGHDPDPPAPEDFDDWIDEPLCDDDGDPIVRCAGKYRKIIRSLQQAKDIVAAHCPGSMPKAEPEWLVTASEEELITWAKEQASSASKAKRNYRRSRAGVAR